MNEDDERGRRRFLRTALAVTAALASPWTSRPALAAAQGRVLIGFQVPPTVQRLHSTLLAELRSRYRPDLGATPVLHPGGSGMLAATMVGQSPPDGATVMISPSSSMTLGRIVRNLSVDPADALLPVGAIGDMVLGFIVGPAVPAEVRTVSDYVQWARTHPASDRYGIPGFGTAPHFIGSQMSRLADLPLHAVAYKGTAALVDDISAGNVPAGITVLPGIDEVANYPRVRLLAIANDQRVSRLPDVPTLLESGLGESIPTESVGLFLPVGTPEPKVLELAAAVDAALTTRVMQMALVDAGITPLSPSVDPYAVTIARERSRWQALVALRNFPGQG